MLIPLKDNESKKTETVWSGNGFFDEQRSDLTITKPNFPENALVYVNQGSISTVKGGHAIYLEFVILGQLMPVANPDPQINLENRQFNIMRLVCSYQFTIKQQGCMVVSLKS